MNVRQYLLFIYRVLLVLYPPSFRNRFAAEMVECAEAAEPAEWPLIFADTSVGIVRCWFEPRPAAAAVAEPNAYLALGESPVRSSGFVRGFVLAIALFIGLCYFSHWTAYKECPGTASESVRR
jgi:hypothetical protein